MTFSKRFVLWSSWIPLAIIRYPILARLSKPEGSWAPLTPPLPPTPPTPPEAPAETLIAASPRSDLDRCGREEADKVDRGDEVEAEVASGSPSLVPGLNRPLNVSDLLRPRTASSQPQQQSQYQYRTYQQVAAVRCQFSGPVPERCLTCSCNVGGL